MTTSTQSPTPQSKYGGPNRQGTNENPATTANGESQRPSNEYVLNVAFVSFLAFTLVQTGFALKAQSQAMLTDSAAMFVDALTYLFNLLAEHLKNKPYTEAELRMDHASRRRRRKLKRLYLELIPPAISVTTLLAVTVIALREAFTTLLGPLMRYETTDEDQPAVSVMLFFSALNLVLDVMNVTCFARADQAIGIGLPVKYDNTRSLHHGISLTERSSLLGDARQALEAVSQLPSYEGGDSVDGAENSLVRSTYNAAYEGDSEAGDTISTEGDFLGLINLNLNMCSAWTHVCADTLRSVAVLVAAAIAMVFEGVTPEAADSTAAIVVSFIIIFSLGPLFQGLFLTACEIRTMNQEKIESTSVLGRTVSV